MLVMLLPDQISEKWNVIKYAIEEALPPTVDASPKVMNNILMSLLDGLAQCWVDYEVENEGNKVYAVAVTTVIEDSLSDTKTLQLYSVFGVRPLEDERWIKAFETVRKFAKANGCIKITAYSNLDRIEEVAKLVGGEVDWKFLSFPV